MEIQSTEKVFTEVIEMNRKINAINGDVSGWIAVLAFFFERIFIGEYNP